MKKLVVAAGLLVCGSLALQDVSLGHGGTYRGPGDTVPPGGGGGGGGGGSPAGPAPSAPGAPGVGGPAAPAPAGSPGAPSAAASAPTTSGGGPTGPDLTVWDFWWEFNKDPFINLKSHIHQGGTFTGEDSWFLGHGQKKQSKDSLRPTEQQIRQEVVPALKLALEKETNNDIVTGALVALAKIGDESSESGESEFEQLILPFLKDGNQEIRETAAVALGILANDASVPTLTSLLRDSPEGRRMVGTTEVSFRTRSFSAYGLALIGSRTADEALRQEIVKNLADMLDATMARDRDIKVACLIAMGLVPLDTIEPPTPTEEDQPLLAHESRLGQIEFALDYFERDGENFLIRAHAPTTLARLLSPPDGVAPLPDDLFVTYKERIATELMKRLKRGSDARNEEVQSVIVALGMLGDNDADKIDQEIRKELTGINKNQSDQQSRNFAQIALGKVGGRMGRGEEPDKGIKDVQKELLTQLGRGKSALRPWSGLGVGVMCDTLAKHSQSPSPDLTNSLRAALDDEGNPSRVGAYAIAAGIAKDEESTKFVLKKLDKIRDDTGRGYCAVALGLLNARDAIEPIQTIVKESKYRPDLLKQAAISLGLLGDKALVPDLIDMLNESRSLATQASISSALGFIGDQRSITPLVEMLHDKSLTERARGFAAVALGIVADKEPLPWNSKIGVDLNYRASAETLNDQQGTGILNIL